MNAFAASDGLLVPLQCEYYALEGISMMNRVLGQLRDAGVNPRLDIFGVVMTMFDGRTKLSNEVVGEVRNLLGAKVFETMIPRSTQAWPKRRVSANPSFIMTNTVPARRRMNCWRRKSCATGPAAAAPNFSQVP